MLQGRFCAVAGFGAHHHEQDVERIAQLALADEIGKHRPVAQLATVHARLVVVVFGLEIVCVVAFIRPARSG